MPRLSLDDLLSKCSPGVRKLNPAVFQAGGVPPLPQPEPPVRNGSQEAPPCQTLFSARVLVRITSFRCQPADPDNICVKHMVDCLRHSRVIVNDRAVDLDLKVAQKKVRTRAEERTEIVVIPLD